MLTTESLDQKEVFHSHCTVNPLFPDEVFLFVLTLNLILTQKKMVLGIKQYSTHHKAERFEKRRQKG